MAGQHFKTGGGIIQTLAGRLGFLWVALGLVFGAALSAQPLAPTVPYVDSVDAQAGTQGDPVNGIVTKPRFSAVFNHNDGGALATEARVQFATDDAFTNIVGGSGWQVVTGTASGRISDVAYNGGALECNTRYWWRIRIKDDLDVVSPWSTEAASFVTIECPHEPHTLFVDSDDAQAGTQGDPVLNVSTKPSFSAFFTHDSPTATASEARVQFATDDAFANIVGASPWRTVTGSAGGRISDVDYTGGALACGVRYYWRIRIKDGAGVISPWSTETASFITHDCPEEPVTLFVGSTEAQTGTQGNPVTGVTIQPSFSAVVTHTDPNASVSEGRVQFALDENFTNVIGGSGWQTFTATQAGNRSPDITYNGGGIPGNTRVYWRIRFRDTTGITGPWSTEPASFETVDAPLAPTSLFVGSDEAQTGTQGNPVTGIGLEPKFSAIFDHQDSSATATRFRVQMASDALFENIIHTQAQNTGGTTVGSRTADLAYSGPGLTPGGTYYWRARFRDHNDVWGPWSNEAASFTTGVANVPDAILSLSGLLQGTDTVANVTKSGGPAFPAGVSVSFDSAEVTVLQTTVTGNDTLQITIRTGNRAPHGQRVFQVFNGTTVVAHGETHVFHPLQRRPSRINSAPQEALNSAAMIGAGVIALQGEFRYNAVDVSIRGRRLPLTFNRAYRSFLGYNGATGQSWSSVVDAAMRFSSSQQEIQWLTPYGRVSTLVLAAGGQPGTGPYVELGSYIAWLRFDAGTPGDDTDDVFVGTGPQGDETTYTFAGRDFAGEAVYRLSSQQDRFGNRIEYVRDTLGQLTEIRGDLYDQSEPARYVLTLQYGADGRLIRIQDYADYSTDETHIGSSFLGARAWDFIYSNAGNLIEVRGPATDTHGSDNAGTSGRARELYGYLAETAQGHHLMRELFVPVQANLELSTSTGVPWLRNTFDTSNRVVSQDVGAPTKTDETHRHFLKYSGSTVDSVDPLGRRQTVTMDSQGRPLQITAHTGTFELDQFGVIQLTGAKLRPTDPDNYNTVYEYNLHGELTRLILPKGNERRWLYDSQNLAYRSQGNLLRAVVLPGSVDVSALPAPQRNGLLVTYLYEPTFNLPVEQVPSHAYDLAANFDITQALPSQLSRDDSQQYRTVFEYDSVGQLIRATGPAIDAAHSPESPNVGQQLVREYQYNAFGQVITSRDMSSYPTGYAGVDIDYEYGTSGFNHGYLTARVTDPTGLAERIELAYDSVGNVRTMKAPHGAVQTSIRDQLGRVVRSISPAIASLNGIQYTVEYSWDQNGNLTQRTIHDPVLDAQGLPTAAVRNIVDVWSYGVFGNVVSSTGSVTDQATRTFSSFYDAAYQLIEQHSPGGTKVVHSYDELGRPFRSFSGLAIGAALNTAIASTTLDYDLNSNPQRTTDPRGFQRTREFDAYDRLLTAADARSSVTTRLTVAYAHGASPAEVMITGDDGTGNRVTLSHRKEWQDNQGRMFRTANLALASDMTTPLGYAATETGSNDTIGWSVSTYLMLPDGRLTSIVGDLLDGSGPAASTQAWTMEYDGAGRTSRILDPVGNIREFTYVTARLTQELEHSIDTGTQVMQTSRNAYEYDELSRVISRQACTQDPVLFRFDARNNIVRIADPRSGVTRFDYDLANRMVNQTRSASGLWALTTTPTASTNRSEDIESVFEFDLDDNLTRAIDNAGNQTTYAYDLAGRLLQTHFANGGKATVGTSHALTAIPDTAAYFQTTAGYDAAGNVLQLLDEGGNQITRTFSPEHEVLSMQIVKGQNSLIDGTSTVSWEYDGLGRVLRMVTTQFGGETHTRTQAWNSLSLLEAYTEQVNAGPTRQYLRFHDESGRNYATQSPDATINWTRDLLGRMKSYTVTRSGHATINGAWSYYGRGGLRSARAVSGDEDIEAQRDQRGRMVGVASVSRQPGGAQRNPFRYLYDEHTGRLDGMLNLDRRVVSGESRIGQPSAQSVGTGRVFGTRTFYDGFGRVTGFASDVTYSQGATNASGWSSHPDTQASASEFDRVDFPTETGVFLGEQFMNNAGVGYLQTPHASTYGSTSSPLPQGDGSRFVPDASGDVDLEKTSDDELKIANDGSNSYIYDYRGRVVRATRVSDGTTVDERKYDGTGLFYDHQIHEYQVVNHDFAAPNLAGMTISTPNVRLDGGGLRFVGVTENEFVQFAFPADVRRNSGGAVQGGLTSYHDFLIDRNSSSSFLCNFYFADYRSPQARFRLEVGGTVLKLFFRAFQGQDETLVAQGSLAGTGNGPVSMGVRIESSLSFSPTTFQVFAGGSSRLFHSQTIGGEWAATNVLFETGDNSTRLYRYKGYLDFDFSQADLRVIEFTPEGRVLQMLCGTNVAPGTTTPTANQDNTVAYQMYKDQVIEHLAGLGDAGMAQVGAIIAANNQSGNMSCGDPQGNIADLLCGMEAAMQQARAAEACVQYGNALTDFVDELLSEAEEGFEESPAPADLGAFLVQNNQFLNSPPSIEMDPVVMIGSGDALVVPFTIRLPYPQRVQLEATGPGGSGLPAGLVVDVLSTSTQFGALEYTGEITWTPPMQAEGQAFDVHIRALVPAITAMDGRPFAQAKCRIEVLPAVTTTPVLSVSASPNVEGESAFEFAHSQEEFHTTYAGATYALWREASTFQNWPLYLDFTAFSNTDTNFTWDASGLTGTWGIAANGDTAQVQWEFPQPGIYDLQVTATNSQGQGVINVRLRVMPDSRAWNIRREHTSVVTCVWDGQTNHGAVWGSGYGTAGHKHIPLPYGAWDDVLGIVESYISNGDFVYLAGHTQYNINGQVWSSPGPVGPFERLPDGLLSRAAISQQIQDWTQQFRDAIEFLNDQIAAFSNLINNQLAQMQAEAEAARIAEEERVRAEQAQAARDAEWEFLGMRGRDGGIEFGDAFAIEWAGYEERAEATWAGAVFQTGDFLSGYQIHTDEDRAGMYEYYASQGLENYYMAGGAVGKTTVVLAAATVTGGAAGGAVGGAGASGGFTLFTEVAVSSATFSAGNQYAMTGTVSADAVARDTLIGLGTAGVIKGGGQAVGALRNLRQPTLNALPGGPGATTPAGLAQYKQFKQAVNEIGGNMKYTKGNPFVKGTTVNVNPRTLTQQQMIDEYAHLWNNVNGRGQNLGFPRWADDHIKLGLRAEQGGTMALGGRNFEFHQLELANMLGSGHRPAFMQGVSRMELSRFLWCGR